MTLINRNSLFPTFGTLLEDFLNEQESSVAQQRSLVPRVNITESEDGFQVDVAAPGYDKGDFKIELDHGLLTISSEKQNEQESQDEQQKFNRREFFFSSFKRSFQLPENTVQEEAIEAKYENGILKLHLPKREEVKPQPKRLIEIS